MRHFVGAHFHVAVQLAEDHDRHLQFLGQQFELAAEVAYLLLTVLGHAPAGHELQIVDDHEFQVFCLLQPAAFRSNIRDLKIRGIIDIQWLVLELLPKTVDGSPSFVGHLRRVAENIQRNVRLGGEQALRDFLTAHFQAEDDCALVVVNGRIPCEVHSQRGLSHGRASGDDDHLPRLQTVGHVIDVPESGVDSFGDFPLLNLVEMVKHIGGNRIDVLVIGTGIVLADMERLIQGVADDAVGVGIVRMTHLRYAGADGDDVASFRRVFDHVRVDADIRRGRSIIDELADVVQAANTIKHFPLGQCHAKQCGVNVAMLIGQVADQTINRFVVRLVEVVFRDFLTRLVNGGTGLEHRT